jgi:hypothetical protein
MVNISCQARHAVLTVTNRLCITLARLARYVHTYAMSTPVAHWVPDVEDFSARLVLIRHEMKWNLKEAALACGVRAQSWRDWELAGRRPRDYEGVCKQIAERTGCNLIWLMAGDPNLLVPPVPPGDKPVDWLPSAA